MAETVKVAVSFRAAGRFFAQGDQIPADHPAVAKYPAMFDRSATRVRTTASVPGVVTDPDTTSGGKPAVNAPKAVWRSYVASLGGVGLDDLTKAELVDLAAELEG